MPCTLALSIALGALLMFSRLLFGMSGSAANSDDFGGALVITTDRYVI